MWDISQNWIHLKKRVKTESMNFNQDYNQDKCSVLHMGLKKSLKNAEMLENLFKNQFMQNERAVCQTQMHAQYDQTVAWYSYKKWM